MSATLTPCRIAMTRACDRFGIFRGLRVLIDAEQRGIVEYAGRAEFAVEPGVHLVQVAMDWCRSRPFEVVVGPGETIELTGGAPYRGLLWMLNLLHCLF